MKQYAKIISILALGILMVGCRSSKSTSSPDYDKTVTDATANYNTMITDYHDWSDVSMPVKVSIKKPSGMSVSGRARIVRGESIYISFRVFGMEMAQLYVDNDSIHASYKLKKLYISESLAAIKGDFPLSLDNIQDMLLGQAFLLGDKRLDSSDINRLSLNAIDNNWDILPKATPNGIQYGFRLSAENLLLRLVAGATDESVLAIAEYSDHQSTPAGNIAEKVNIDVTKGLRNIEASLTWSLGSAQWNTGITNQWKEPSGYTRIPLDKLVKTLSEN